MIRNFYIGVDGGATKSIIRVEDDQGRLVGREIDGPANIRISVEQAWQSIYSALEKILSPQQLNIRNEDTYFHIGLGLAGCEISAAYQKFIELPHPFKTLRVSTDAHTACLGAHNGRDGAIIIAGTGVVGFQLCEQEITKIAGWGFPHDDAGGGAWLGLEAVKITLQTQDGRLSSSGLSQAIFQHFKNNLNDLVHWANHANSGMFAELAPVVMQQARNEDSAAIDLLKKAASSINQIWLGLQNKQHNQALKCVFMGGVSEFIEPYLSGDLKKQLIKPLSPPDAGALWLVKTSTCGSL